MKTVTFFDALFNAKFVWTLISAKTFHILMQLVHFSMAYSTILPQFLILSVFAYMSHYNLQCVCNTSDIRKNKMLSKITRLVCNDSILTPVTHKPLRAVTSLHLSWLASVDTARALYVTAWIQCCLPSSGGLQSHPTNQICNRYGESSTNYSR